MKLLILAAITITLSAATWDGKHDDLTVMTIQLNSGFFGPTGLPALGMPDAMEIFVSSTDKEITAFRVSIEYSDATGVHQDSRTISPGDHGMMALAFFPLVKVDKVSSVVVTRLRDAKSEALPR